MERRGLRRVLGRARGKGVQSTPFSVSLAAKNNITAGEGWSETMPSWSTDPAAPDTLIYSASR